MKLLIFGMGYTAQALVHQMQPLAPGAVIGTTRSEDKAAALRDMGVEARLFPGTDLRADLEAASHVLITAGPQDGADPVLHHLRPVFADLAPRFDWVGYLSTTGVYGDHQGGWVDENAALTPATKRGRARVATESEWQALARDHGLPLHIFRLPGIYGPGRGPFEKVRNGTARRIIKAGQVFSRIHVEDIAQALRASMARPVPGAIYNICDDDPAPPQDVLTYAAQLLGVDLPPTVPFEEAEMSPMARSFYAESKRVDNTRMKRELGVRLRYPTYRAGLDALFATERDKS
ncbi:MAG: SDR family oxidoreductase [Nioella sp.]